MGHICNDPSCSQCGKFYQVARPAAEQSEVSAALVEAQGVGSQPPEVLCKNCHQPIWFDGIPGRGWRHKSPGGGGSYNCAHNTKAEPAASPETAAQPPDGNFKYASGPTCADTPNAYSQTPNRAQPMSERELGKNVVDAALSLLEWVPTASRGSSGYSRQETLRIAIERWQAARAGMGEQKNES